jgi:hypothetical protein
LHWRSRQPGEMLMSIAHDISGVAFKNGSVILLARVLGADGLPITGAALGAIDYTIYQLDQADPNSETAIAGHAARALTVGEIILDTLQTDELWDADEAGYNFKHVLDVSEQQAFTIAGLFYRVRYRLTAVAGQQILVRFKLKVI